MDEKRKCDIQCNIIPALKSEIMSYAKTWVNLGVILLSEISQSQKINTA
jgi:hypothetical protein